jgi:hypothetical protein
MRGTIIGFDPDTNTGAIGAEDGGRYDFERLEWRGANQPSRGAVVDFVPDGMQARQVYAVDLRANPAEGETAKLIYILYLVSLIVGITAIVGVIMAYVNRRRHAGMGANPLPPANRHLLDRLALRLYQPDHDLHRDRLSLRSVHAGVVDRALGQGLAATVARRALRQSDHLAVVASARGAITPAKP